MDLGSHSTLPREKKKAAESEVQGTEQRQRELGQGRHWLKKIIER